MNYGSITVYDTHFPSSCDFNLIANFINTFSMPHIIVPLPLIMFASLMIKICPISRFLLVNESTLICISVDELNSSFFKLWWNRLGQKTTKLITIWKLNCCCHQSGRIFQQKDNRLVQVILNLQSNLNHQRILNLYLLLYNYIIMNEFGNRASHTNITKHILNTVNRVLQSLHSPAAQISILSTFHTFRNDYPLSKNLLILCNNILRYLNSFPIFRKQWIIGLVSVGLGLGFAYADDKYYQIIELQRQRQQMINGLLAKHVLQNKTIQKLLIKILSDNVFPNQSIHYQLRQVILHAGIQPQIPKIKSLVKQVSLNALRDQNSFQWICKAIKPIIKQLQNPIVIFLKSQLFQSIVTDGIRKAINEEGVQNVIRDQVVQTVRNNLKDQHNMEALYKLIKAKALNIL